jgi:hypothetical protein
MMSRSQITLDPELHRRALSRASELRVSFAGYVRRLIAKDLGHPEQTTHPSVLFNLGRSKKADVARHKDAMVGEAMAARRRAGSRRS